MASLLIFPPYLQQAVEQGVLTPAQAWNLEWDLEQRTFEPWAPGVQQISRTVELFHLPMEQMRAQ